MHAPTHIPTLSDLRPGYRPNVCAVVRNPTGEILWCERADAPGSWQFPQGGIDEDESPRTALWRELGEELGVSNAESLFVLERAAPQILYYDFPAWLSDAAPVRNAFKGQGQFYFLLSYDGSLDAFSLEPPPGCHKEFRSLAFGDSSRLASVIEFKRPTLEAALAEFGLL